MALFPNQAGQSSPTPKFYTKKQLGHLLGLSLPTIDRRLKAGIIPCVHIGYSVRIPAQYVEALMAQANGQGVQ